MFKNVLNVTWLNYGLMRSAMDITLVCDPMMDLTGSIQPAIFLAEELAKRYCKVYVLSPFIQPSVESTLLKKGIFPLNLDVKIFMGNFGASAALLEAWLREAFLKFSLPQRILEKPTLVINFSNMVVIPSQILYLQGPLSKALNDIKTELPLLLRFIYKSLRPLIDYADRRLISSMGKFLPTFIANSKFCASMYTDFGFDVKYVIYPPIDCHMFIPSTSDPSSDYVLSYFGKETKFSVIKRIADEGVKIKAFGSKTPFLGNKLIKHSNIEFLGRISTKELVEVYSNALFTVFPFTHEPFGYVPLESMACGTPVLTYNHQGPSEYVIDGVTGWLVDSDEEMIARALKLWKDGYPCCLRGKCVKEAAKFDRKNYAENWVEVLKKIFDVYLRNI